MAKNTRFQRFKEWVRNRVQGLGGWLTRIWTKGIAWGYRRADVGRVWMQKLQRQWSKIWQGIWNGQWKMGDQLQRHPILWVVIACVLIFSFLWIIPKWQVAGAILSDKERLELEDKARGTLAQIIGGMAVLISLYFTWRSAVAAWQTVQVNQEGQITERFTRAIDQLGVTDENGRKRLELRLGGIYALERIARDSEKDHWPIMEVLTAYVREHTRWEGSSQPQQGQLLDSETQPRPDTDIQAILTVLGRRPQTRWYGQGENQRLNLCKTDMRRVSLRYAHLEGANLSEANLEGADLLFVYLQGVNLQDAHLQGADLRGAHLEGANLQGAHLQKAKLQRAHLEGTFLRGAYLQGADLQGAYLQRAKLQGAHLEGADLLDAHLENAFLRGTHLEGVILRDAHLQGADLGEANLEGANLEGAKLQGTWLLNTILRKAHLQGADLRTAHGLTPEQLASAYTNDNTLLPDYLTSDEGDT